MPAKSRSYSSLIQDATPAQRAVLDGLSEQLELSGEWRVSSALNALKRKRNNGNRRGRKGNPKDQLRKKIARELKWRWPELANTLNPGVIELLTTRSDEFISAIEEHPDYERYRNMPVKSRPNTRKQKVKYERFLREANSVALAQNLRRSGFSQRLDQYEQIVAAESMTLASAPDVDDIANELSTAL